MNRRNARAGQRGFTLVELMVVVAIAGVLATLAIPSYQRLIYRTKTAERTLLMTRIKQQVEDFYRRTGAGIDPTKHAGATTLDSGWNPPWVIGQTPSATKSPLVTDVSALPVWAEYFSNGARTSSSLGQEIEGGVYYIYYFRVEEGAVNRITVWSQGDLDGDGVMSVRTMQWDRVNGVYQLTSDVESVPDVF